MPLNFKKFDSFLYGTYRVRTSSWRVGKFWLWCIHTITARKVEKYLYFGKKTMECRTLNTNTKSQPIRGQVNNRLPWQQSPWELGFLALTPTLALIGCKWAKWDANVFPVLQIGINYFSSHFKISFADLFCSFSIPCFSFCFCCFSFLPWLGFFQDIVLCPSLGRVNPPSPRASVPDKCLALPPSGESPARGTTGPQSKSAWGKVALPTRGSLETINQGSGK